MHGFELKNNTDHSLSLHRRVLNPRRANHSAHDDSDDDDRAFEQCKNTIKARGSGDETLIDRGEMACDLILDEPLLRSSSVPS